MTCERLADLLDAALDGEADALSTRSVEEHLAQCPACSAQMAARRALQISLRKNLPYYHAPESLKESQPWNQPAKSNAHLATKRPFRYALAASLVLTAGIAIGLSIRPAPAPDLLATLSQAIETDHLRSLQESHLFDVASTDQHTVKPWFAGKLPFAPPVPDFPDFPLKGGRLDWVNGTQAAALVYARNKHTINLFIWPAGNAALPAVPTARATGSGHHLIFWSDSPLNFAAISDVEATQLADFATAYRAAAK